MNEHVVLRPRLMLVNKKDRVNHTPDQKVHEVTGATAELKNPMQKIRMDANISDIGTQSQ